MRVAIALYHGTNLEAVLKCYNQLNHTLYTHATPTIFGAGVIGGPLSSCFLLRCDDSKDGIMDIMKSMADISTGRGASGLSLDDIRHSEIALTGYSKGLMPLMYMLDAEVSILTNKD